MLVLLLGFGVLIGFWFIKKSQTIEKKEDPKTPEVNLHQIASDLLTPNPLPTSKLTKEGKELSAGVSIFAVPYEYNGSSYEIQVVKIDPKLSTLSLKYNQEGKTVGQWTQDQSNVIVMNAGFFKENNEPVGLLYIDGQRRDAHRVNPSASGLLLLNQNRVQILNLANSPIPDESALKNALQTFPVLIDKGNIVANENLTKQDRRSAIGVDKEGKVYLITADYPHLGLYDFSKTLHDSSLQFTEVLNLDGGGSTGMAINIGEYKDLIESISAVPTVLEVSYSGRL